MFILPPRLFKQPAIMKRTEGPPVNSPVFLSDFNQILSTRQILIEVLSSKFHGNKSNGIRADICGQTD